MIVEIFIPQRNPINPLTDQGLQTVLGPLRIAVVSKTPRKPLENTKAPLHLAQHHPARIRTNHPPIKSPDHFAPSQLLKCHLFLYTLCFHKAALLLARNCLLAQLLCHEERP